MCYIYIYIYNYRYIYSKSNQFKQIYLPKKYLNIFDKKNFKNCKILLNHGLVKPFLVLA